MCKGFADRKMPKAFLSLALLTAVLTSLVVLGISPEAWSESALIHNSNRFGTCSNAAFSGTSQAICETNGGVWTPSTKWGGSWGVPAGQYGEFVCETCHERGSDNIKNVISRVTAPSGTFPGSTINFLSTTAPNGFGDDTGGHTTSDKVCEVCHSTTLYHRYDTTGQTVFDHNNNSDCVVCHTHSKGFKPEECDSCHGYPPIASVPNASSPGGNTGLADNPYATGSLTAGAHDRHVNGLGYANCAICHNGYTMPSDAGTYTIDISFSFNGSTTGTYDGQTTARYNAPNTATGNMTCSTVYCHSNVQSAAGSGAPDSFGTPAWNNAASVQCGTCHNADGVQGNASVMASGSHSKHVGAPYTKGCTECHSGGGAGTAEHVNRNINTGFAADPFATTGAYSQSPNIPGDGYGSCSNVYCHSIAQTNGGSALVKDTTNYKNPSWGGSVVCGDCHSIPPASGKHAIHADPANYGFDCWACHNNAGINKTTGVPTAKHTDQNVDMSFDPVYGASASYSQSPNPPGNGYGTCSTLYCHSNAKGADAGSGVAQYATPGWTDTLTCSSCHGVEAGSKAGEPAYANGGSGSVDANTHAKHVNSLTDCNFCHSQTADASGAIQISLGKHVNLAKDVNFSGGIGGSYDSGTKTCATTYCHGTSSPVWGATNTNTDCTWCHGGNAASAAPITLGNHPEHMNQAAVLGTNYDCAQCHNATVSAGNDLLITGTVHANGTKNVAFELGGTWTSPNCSSVYCHSSGKGTFVDPPVWGSTTDLGCNGCHGTTSTVPGAPDYASGAAGSAAANSHQNLHVTASSDCNTCHTDTTTTGTEIKTGSTLHTNNAINVSFDTTKTGAGASYDSGAKSCSTTFCHGSGAPVWGGNTANSTCEKCHGSAATIPFRDTAGNTLNTDPKVGAHVAHLNAAHGYSDPVACSTCHNVPASVYEAGHIDTAVPAEVSVDCATTACHGQGLIEGVKVPTWNVPLLTGVAANDCTKCHGYPSAGIPAHVGKVPADCHTCHNNVNAAGDGFTPAGRALHVNGIVNVTADSCSDCHSSAGGAASGTTPDAYHAKHVQTAYVGTLSGGDYGNFTTNTWYAYSNTGGVPDMGCGYCHPQSAATHNNGSVDLNIANNDTGATGTLKEKNAATPSFTQNSRVSVTCSSVYCHSNGYGPTYAYQTTPEWYGGTFAGDKCASCHGNSPSSTIAGSAAHGAHVVGIHYKNIYSGAVGKLAEGGATGAAHGDPATSTTINCNVCHSSTVTVAFNDSNTVCVTCHTGATQKGTTVIDAASTSHINGTPDVSFGGFSVKSKSQLRDSIASVAELNNSWTRTNGYKAASSFDASKRTPAYTGGTCSTVDCHNGNPVSWSTAGPLSCGACHTALPQ